RNLFCFRRGSAAVGCRRWAHACSRRRDRRAADCASSVAHVHGIADRNAVWVVGNPHANISGSYTQGTFCWRTGAYASGFRPSFADDLLAVSDAVREAIQKEDGREADRNCAGEYFGVKARTNCEKGTASER